jgi:two-component system, chemotaxis family, CheB/CheR fusion protein
VETANNGLNGISSIQDFTPDIILLNIGMPDIGGYQVDKIIREQSHFKKFVAIAMSDYSPDQSIHDTDTPFIDHYLLMLPPFSELQNLIKRYQHPKQSGIY